MTQIILRYSLIFFWDTMYNCEFQICFLIILYSSAFLTWQQTWTTRSRQHYWTVRFHIVFYRKPMSIKAHKDWCQMFSRVSNIFRDSSSGPRMLLISLISYRKYMWGSEPCTTDVFFLKFFSYYRPLIARLVFCFCNTKEKHNNTLVILVWCSLGVLL